MTPKVLPVICRCRNIDSQMPKLLVALTPKINRCLCGQSRLDDRSLKSYPY